MNKKALIIFAKNPVKGKVKTRLADTIGEEKALVIYKELLGKTYINTRGAECDKFLFLTEHFDNTLFDNTYNQYLQHGDNLGERMKNAFEDIFRLGYKKICIIGTDAPELSLEIIIDAFFKLNHCDIAIGPANDGGYYLLGMKKLHASLFQQIKWGSEDVLKDTILKIENDKLTYYLSEQLIDVDTEEDLKTLKFNV